MENMEHRDWYGENARILEQKQNFTKIDYGCRERGNVFTYQVFDGIQVTFMEFETDEKIESKKFESDILCINYCKTGRYECEFLNHTSFYLPESCFSVNNTRYLPETFSFPLKKYDGVSIVIEKKKLSSELRQVFSKMSMDVNYIDQMLGLDKKWYVSSTTAQLKQVFDSMYEARNSTDLNFFRIKVVELLYYIVKLPKKADYDLHYYEQSKVNAVKNIHSRMIKQLDTKIPIEELVKKEHICLTTFQVIFRHVYGDTPYAYMKKYKMNIAASKLKESNQSIGDIAVSLGYNNASKFSKAFFAVYGVLPNEYRRKQ